MFDELLPPFYQGELGESGEMNSFQELFQTDIILQEAIIADNHSRDIAQGMYHYVQLALQSLPTTFCSAFSWSNLFAIYCSYAPNIQ